MFSTKVWRADCNLLRKLRAMIAIRSWIVLTTVFTSCALTAAADIHTGKAQIQGGVLDRCSRDFSFFAFDGLFVLDK